MVEVPKGVCARCSREYSSRGMTRHLGKCAGSGRNIHLRFVAKGSPLWWLHVAVAPTATLADIDDFLRDLWLECCGHLSTFTIKRVRYDVTPDPYGWGAPARSMTARASLVIKEGSSFEYEYDYGSTTHLGVRHLGSVRGGRQKVELLARNNDVGWMCGCEVSATSICAYCGKVACDACVLDEGECSGCGASFEECALPLVNSPRTGVCGYVGPQSRS